MAVCGLAGGSSCIIPLLMSLYSSVAALNFASSRLLLHMYSSVGKYHSAEVALQVTFPLVLDTYEFCSDKLKKQLDAPRVAVREEEDRKADIDRAAKKAKMVIACLYRILLVGHFRFAQLLPCNPHWLYSNSTCNFTFQPRPFLCGNVSLVSRAASMC